MSVKTVHLQYFASLREQRGLTEESIETEVSNLAELYEELKTRHQFNLPLQAIKVAMDDEFVDTSSSFENGARVVFIPPVAGG